MLYNTVINFEQKNRYVSVFLKIFIVLKYKAIAIFILNTFICFIHAINFL